MKFLRNRYRHTLILLRQLVKVDFRLRYEGSALGMLWSALKPLMLFAVLYMVFINFLRFGEGIPHFEVSLLLGIVLWNFFAETTATGLRSIVGNGQILRKVSLPKYVFVLSSSISALINLGINLVVCLIFALINGVELTPLALLALPLLIECYVFAVSLGFLLGAIYVRFRDIAHIWDVFMQAAYFATPIIYPLSMVSEMSATAAKMLLLNPMAQIIQDLRYVLISTQTDTVWNYIGNPLFTCVPLVLVVVVAVGSLVYFRRASAHFAEEV